LLKLTALKVDLVSICGGSSARFGQSSKRLAYFVIVLALGEGGSLFTIFFNDLTGRYYSIEFTNFPCKIHYLCRSSWFGPTRRFLVTPEIMEDDEDQGEDSKTWVTKEVKGSELGESD